MTMVLSSRPLALMRGEDSPEAVVELAGAAVVERADLLDFLFRQGLPLGLEVGAADERVDVEVHAVAVGSLVVGIGEHAAVGFADCGRADGCRSRRRARRTASAGRRLGEALFDPAGDDFRCDELGEGLELRERSGSRPDCRNRGHHEVRHDHRLAHVDPEIVESGDREVFNAERHDFIVARAPVADGRGVVAALRQQLGRGAMRFSAASTFSRSGYIWRMPWVCGYWRTSAAAGFQGRGDGV